MNSSFYVENGIDVSRLSRDYLKEPPIKVKGRYNLDENDLRYLYCDCNLRFDDLVKYFNINANTLRSIVCTYNIRKDPSIRYKNSLKTFLKKSGKEYSLDTRDQSEIDRIIKEESIDTNYLATHTEEENIRYLYIEKNLNKEQSMYILNMTGVTFDRRLYKYNIHKSLEDSQKRKRKTCLKKYGTEVITQSELFKEKAQKTNLERYGVKEYTQCKEYLEKTKNTCLKKYGATHHTKTQECKEKHINTCLERYGVENPFLSEEAKLKSEETCLKKYGARKYQSTAEYKEIMKNQKDMILKKSCDTKRKNGTFNTSKPEEEVFKLLSEKFTDVKRQYRTKEYPFNCDFYIPELNLYIEYQGSWTHGNHPFDETNPEDIEILEEMKERAKTSDYYVGAIEVWTLRDPLKRKTAKDNNLNWKEFFNMEEFLAWCNKL